MIPANSTTAITPISVSVSAALRLLGLRKAGTPLLIASTPVNAVQPDAKARTSRITVNIPPMWMVAGNGCRAVWANANVPPQPLTAATTNINKVKPMNV